MLTLFKRIAGALLLTAGLICFSNGASAQQAADAGGTSSPYTNSAVVELRPRVERASFNLRRPDLRALYGAIAQAYGIRLLYDRDLTASRTASNFDLQGVTLHQALEAAADITKTFVAPVDERTGIVAADAAPKHGEYERQVLGTFQVDHQTTPQQMTEITTALRSFVELGRVVQDNRTNVIAALGRTHQMQVAREFIGTIQRPRGEVVLDMDFIEVDLQKARQLGMAPPQPLNLLFAANPVPLTALKVVSTLYGVQLPGAAATLTYSSSAVRTLQTGELRAQDGQDATLTLGDRVPVLSGFTSSSFYDTTTGAATNTGLGSYPLVQYQDVGIKMKVTPYLHAGGELTVQLELSQTSLTGQTLNQSPIIANREVKQQIRLRDGETYLLAGILDRQETNNVSGYPWLARLPFFGFLFATHSKQQTQTELLVLMKAHIVRLPVAEEYASNTIFFGKELVGLPAAPPAPVPPAAVAPGAPGQPVVQPGIPGQPGVQPGVPPGLQPGVQPGLLPGEQIPPSIVPGQPPGQTPTTQRPLPFQPGVIPGMQLPRQPEQQPSDQPQQ